MEAQEYSNGEITLLWKPDLFIQHPGIKVKNATTQELFGQVAKCPSEALSTKTKSNICENWKTQIVFDDNSGEIQLISDEKKAGKMEVSIPDEKFWVYHTEINPQYSGRGFAKLLLHQLVRYAKENYLRIIPICPFVLKQFKSHPEEYADVWLKKEFKF